MFGLVETDRPTVACYTMSFFSLYGMLARLALCFTFIIFSFNDPWRPPCICTGSMSRPIPPDFHQMVDLWLLMNRGVDPNGTRPQGDMSPQYLWRGTSMAMSPPNILEVMSFRMSTRVTATVVCCFLMQILCVVSQKKLQLLRDFVPQISYQGSAPEPRWGTCFPQTPSLLSCPPQ